jgi:type 1 glutamine amidotransferase
VKHIFMKTIAALLLLSLIAFASSMGCVTNHPRLADKKIILIAGQPSHGPGEHEHRAGLLLFQKCLADFPGIKVEVYTNGWPTNSAVLNGAAAVVIYSDGGGGHPALQADHLQQLSALSQHGVGLACLHYACEPTIEKGQREFLDWIGGCFEINRSVNPHWDADFKTLPLHPITRGVVPFKVRDEWYFNMRFREGMKGVTPILAAVPDADTMYRADGPHEGNPGVRAAVARGEAQTVMWASERGESGRGFGFTGGHFHRNWGDDNFRKIVLNAILWVAQVEVPTNGVQSTVTAADLEANLDSKGVTRKVKAAAVPPPEVK